MRLHEWLRESVASRRTRRITLSGARERACRGAVYLDDVAPGWAEVMDPSSLDLSHGSTCVLGQLHGSFSMGLGRAGVFSLSSAPRASFSPVDLGFHCVQGVCESLQEKDYEHLNRAWHEEIVNRCRGVEPPPRSRAAAEKSARSREADPLPRSRLAPTPHTEILHLE